MFSINMETDNDAFVDNTKGEVLRILLDVTRRIENDSIDPGYRDKYPLFDLNGNIVGHLRWIND